MKIFIQGVPHFHWQPTHAHIALLTALSGMHYDARCKEASCVGGFIYGWKNCVLLAETEASDDAVTVNATWNQLDTCLKIMEMPHGLNDAEKALVYEMRTSFHRALTVANQKCRDWNTESE
jgi:hypothetical protein